MGKDEPWIEEEMLEVCFEKLRRMGFSSTYEKAQKTFLMSEILRKTGELKERKSTDSPGRQISKFELSSPEGRFGMSSASNMHSEFD